MPQRSNQFRRLLAAAWFCLASIASCQVNPQPSPQPSPVFDYTQGAAPTRSASRTNPPIFSDLFEGSSLDPWEHGNGAALTQDAPHQGKQSVRIQNDNLHTVLQTRPGVSYKVAAWIRLLSETGSDWGGFRLEADDDQWKSRGQAGPFLQSTHGSEWIKVAFSFQASSTQTHLQVGYFGGPNRTLVAAVDDLAVFEKGANHAPTLQAAFSSADLAKIPADFSYSLQADDPDGAVVETVWDFGDGSRSFVPSGTHHAIAPGEYLASVTVVDDEGAAVEQKIPWRAVSPDFPLVSLENTPPEVSTPSLALRGKSHPENLRWLVSTDRGFFAPFEGSEDTWKTTVRLSPGLNRILVQATDPAGQVATVQREVRYTPSAPLQVAHLSLSAPAVEQWQPLELAFDVENSGATNPDFPYDPALPPRLAGQDGISVDGLFSPDGWKTAYTRPAFLNQVYDRQEKDGAEWLYPIGSPRWTVRFAPPLPGGSHGEWQYKVRVREARGEITTPPGSFRVTSPQPGNHGPIGVSSRDSRYFEFADGTVFLASGMNYNFSPVNFSYDASQLFEKIGSGNENLFRWWLGGNLWGSAWQPWNSMTLNFDGYLPASGLTLDRASAGGLAALKLDQENPVMFQGWNTGHAGLVPGETYRLFVRWRSEGVAGPRQAGQPYGLTVKFTGWPEPGSTTSIPALIPPVHGDTPWHVAQADFQAEGNYLPNLAVLLENTTAGSAYIDEISLYPLYPDGSLGSQLLRGSRFNSLMSFDSRRGAGIDAILSEANLRGLYFKLVISEKNEFLLNHLSPAGLPDPLGGNFFHGPGSATHWLHRAYWRYLSARFGAFKSVQSWELVNEAAPGPGEPFHMAADLAQFAAADGNPHLASISTWATLAEDAWKDPASASISYVDFHQAIRPQDGQSLLDDTALAFSTFDQKASAAGFHKPVIWGEMGFNGSEDTNKELEDLARDKEGIWLHKLVWARCEPGGVIPLYWFPDNILANNLSPIFGTWNRFMEGIPLSNGNYQDAAARSSSPDLLVLGQKDLAAQNAFLWIDNRQHTWRSALNGQNPPAIDASITLDMKNGGKPYRLDWFDPYTAAVLRTETVQADSSGKIQISVQNLTTDIAVKVISSP